MKDPTGEVLQASSQPEAWRIFEEIIEGDRQKMVTVVGEKGHTEKIDAYRKLREEAASALATLKENLEDVTAVLALPGKYRCRLRTTRVTQKADRGGSSAEESHPHLPEYELGLATDWSRFGRKARGVVHWSSVPEPRRILPVAN